MLEMMKKQGVNRLSFGVQSAHDDELKAIGFIFPNSNAAEDMKLSEAACTVKEIEAQTGFKFFQNLDPAVADAVKEQKKISDWPGVY